MKRRRFKGGSRRSYQTLHLLAKILDVLLQSLGGSRWGRRRRFRCHRWQCLSCSVRMTLCGLRDGLRRPLSPGRRRALTAYRQILLLRQLLFALLLGLRVLFFHDLDAIEVFPNVLVFGAFDRAVGLVQGMAEVFFKKRIDPQNRVLLALWLDDVSNYEGANIAAVFEVARVDRLIADFVENLPALVPSRKHRRGIRAFRPPDELVFVVFLGSADDAILGDILDHLLDFLLRHRDVDDKSFAIGQLLFTAAGERSWTG